MCVNCISNSEAYVAQAALVVAVFKQPVHRVLAEMGLVAPPDPVKQEVRTVAFLRALELDPVAILGEAAVAPCRALDPSVSSGARTLAPAHRLPQLGGGPVDRGEQGQSGGQHDKWAHVG